jgi:hypothetical protein
MMSRLASNLMPTNFLDNLVGQGVRMIQYYHKFFCSQVVNFAQTYTPRQFTTVILSILAAKRCLFQVLLSLRLCHG